MTFQKTLIAAVVSSALAVTGIAEAKKKDDDSVYEWGPWATMATPAAGGSVAGFDTQSGQPGYRPEVVVDEPEYNWVGYVMEWYGPNNRFIHVGDMRLKLDPTSGVIEVEMRMEDGTTHILDQDAQFYAAGEYGRYWGSMMDSGATYRQFVVEGEEYYLDTSNWSHWTYGRVGGDEVTNGLMGRGDESGYSWFVAGRPTSLTDMSALKVGDVSAEYSGYGWFANGGYLTATMRVDFGPGSWSGQWTDVAYYYPNSDINASGTISGNEFTSSSVWGTAVNGQYELSGGSVIGTFVEDNAKSAIGLVDVEYGEGSRIAGTFIAEQVERQLPPPGIDY